MIVKKEWVDGKTGKKTEQLTSDKEGWKVVNGEEVLMSQTEKGNRDHGGKDPNSHGQAPKPLKGVTLNNKKAAKQYKDKKTEKENSINNNVVIKSSKMNESKKSLDKKKKKIDDLSYKLRKAKLDYNSSVLDDKINKFEKKEVYYQMTSKLNERDKTAIKERNKYFLNGRKQEGDVVDHISQVIGKPQTPEALPEDSKEKTIEEKIDRASKIQEMYFGKTDNTIKEDVVDRITSMFEAPKDEEEEDDLGLGGDEGGDEGGDDLGLGGDEEGGDDLGLGDEGGDEEGDAEVDAEEEDIDPEEVDMQNNEIAMHTRVNDFNVEENNVYDFYDFIADKIADPTAKDVLNTEYAQIEPSRRKVTSAKEFFDRVVKRTNIMNNKEADIINQDIGGGDEEDGGGGLGI